MLRAALKPRPSAFRSPKARLHLHAHDASRILHEAHLPVLPTLLARTVAEAEAAFVELSAKGTRTRINAEVLVGEGERAHAVWSSGLKGVEFQVKTIEECREFAQSTLNNTVTAPSTGTFAKACSLITLIPSPPLNRTHHLLLFPSRATHTPVLRATSLSPSTSSSAPIDLILDINSPTINATDLANWTAALDLSTARACDALADAVQKLWTVWRTNDVLRLAVDMGFERTGQLCLIRPSLYIDPFALYRQPALSLLADHSQTAPLELQAAAGKLFYVKKYDGDIACFGFGAGVAMSTMDALAVFGGRPANFMDGGGGASDENVKAMVELALADTGVKAVFSNSFGGLTKTELIAKGMIKVLREQKIRNPTRILPKFIVRLRGTGSEEAEQFIKEATDLKDTVFFFKDMEQAARAAVKAAKEFKS